MGLVQKQGHNSTAAALFAALIRLVESWLAYLSRLGLGTEQRCSLVGLQTRDQEGIAQQGTVVDMQPLLGPCMHPPLAADAPPRVMVAFDAIGPDSNHARGDLGGLAPPPGADGLPDAPCR